MIGALIAKKKTAQAFEYYNKGDLKNFLAGWHDKSTWVYPGNLSVSGEYKSKTEVEKWFQHYMDHFSSTKISVKSIMVQNIFDFVGTNTVSVIWDETVTTKGGEVHELSGITVIHLRFGKVDCAKDYVFNTDEELRKAWGE